MDDFSAVLYGKLRTSSPNLIYSPLGIKVILEMMAAGARGDTLQALVEVIKIAPPLPKDLDPNNFMISNAAFMKDWIATALKPSYRARLIDEYKAQLAHITPKTPIPTLCDIIINHWIEEHTKGMITKMVDPSDLSAADLVLLNAVWFKDKWKYPFDPQYTRNDLFWLSPGNHIDVPFMCHQRERTMLYGDVGIAQILKMPYAGPFSMFIILPKRLEDAENVLLRFGLNSWVEQMLPRKVVVSMPKFSLTSTTQLNQALTQLGLRIIFDKYEADFGNVCSPEAVPFLWVERILHKAKIVVDEEGTEAAAATMAGFSGYSGVPTDFKVNRPFMFVIQHNEIPSTLFVGRIVNPTLEI